MRAGSESATLQESARRAVESACSRVDEGGAADRVDGVQPGLVACPASTEEVAEVMRAAAAHGLAVVPRGRGTKMTWGRPPHRADVVVDVSRLDQVLDHAAGDLVVEAQAGTRLADVQEVVGSARQRLAVDETVPGASIGGTMATATSGPGRLATGTMRDLLIGVTVVRADGVVAKAGGRVVKNVAGYDLGKLVVGSFGTLAVVTDALFRLHPVPAARRFVSVPVADAAQAHEMTQAVVHSQLVPGAGVLYAALPQTTEVPAVAAAVGALRGACTRHGGALVVLDAPGAVKQAGDTWGPVPALDLMRRVKDRFDPDHRLAPGRFVGGI
jgi:glycolate oxidase FAD binding subunit